MRMHIPACMYEQIVAWSGPTSYDDVVFDEVSCVLLMYIHMHVCMYV